jgi:hypothetical protein
MRSQHMAAFMARLEALPTPVYDSNAPLNPDGTIRRGSYVVAWDVGPDSLDDERLTARQRVDSAGAYRYVTKSVGVTPFAAREVHDAVARLVTGHRLAIDGRRCDPARFDPGNDQSQPDTSVSPPLYFIEADWIVPSQRARAQEEVPDGPDA